MRDAGDRELVELAKDGDTAAFALLVQRYQQPLWRFLARWVPEPEDREELVQEVFLAAHQGLRRFRGEARFSTWLFQIGVNQARSHRRRLARRRDRVEIEPGDAGERRLERQAAREDPLMPHVPDAPDSQAVRSQLLRRVWERVAEMPADWQEVMRLHYVEGRSYAEIAQEVDAPLGTVKVWLYRARQQLVEWLEQEGWR